MNTSFIFSDYNFGFTAGQQEFISPYDGIRDYNLKLDLNWSPDIKHNLAFGGNYIYHIFTPSTVSARSGDVEFDLGDDVKFHAHEAALYIQDEWDISKRCRVNVGVRGSLFSHVGPFDRFVLNNVGQVTDTSAIGGSENLLQHRAENIW